MPPRESKSKETGEVLRSRRGADRPTPGKNSHLSDDLMQDSRKVVRRPHAGFTEGGPTPARYFSRNVDEFLEEYETTLSNYFPKPKSELPTRRPFPSPLVIVYLTPVSHSLPPQTLCRESCASEREKLQRKISTVTGMLNRLTDVFQRDDEDAAVEEEREEEDGVLGTPNMT